MVVDAAVPPPPAPTVSIIPRPASSVLSVGRFTFTPATAVVAAEGAETEARRLVESLAPAMGFRLRRAEPGTAGADTILLQLESDRAAFGKEGYELEVSERRMTIGAAAPAGLFYGIQSLRQLLPPAIVRAEAVSGVEWSAPCVRISDRPRLAWRGLMVDTVRHFLPKEALLRFIDAMALHKLNRLQLHLTDDQGWRIEIDKYPRLTKVGAWRKETLIGHVRHTPHRFDGKRHGGFYSQDDIREIVAFAADRHVTVVPEIEMPGHARAAISAYPRLGVFPEKQARLEPWTRWGISEDIFAPRAETFSFLEDVLLEVLELFPSEFVHIGGDEAVKDQWRASEEIQAMIRAKGLADETALQSWFITRMDAFLAGHGRRLVGWDEILEGGLAPGATVMSWRGEKGGIAAANAGHDVVMAPTSHTYFDYYQGPPESEPLAIGGRLPLERVYGYSPVPQAIAADKAHHVLGVQGQLWTEYMPDARRLEYMAYPRAAALAEVAWSPEEGRDYEDFLHRLEPHLKRLEGLGITYRPLRTP